MATLFERVKGEDEATKKIPLHLIQSCLSEIANARMEVVRAIQILELDAPEQADFLVVLTKAQAATDAVTFSNRVFNWLILTEEGVPEYQGEAAFWAMIDEESRK